MSEVKVNKISPRSGTDVTLGDSGDTLTVPSGATLTVASGATINNQGTATNFGATGSASWTTTVKTSTFTAVAGEGYFVNTTGGAITVNLPAGTPGAVVAIKDYAGTFDTNAVTLVQNGSDKIGGSTDNKQLNTEGIAATLIFIDSTQGWLVTDDGLQSIVSQPPYSADFLVVAGGGGGGGGTDRGGGGGAGGFRTSTQSISSGIEITVTVGDGGAGTTDYTVAGTNGSDSSISGTGMTTITSAGGGGGGSELLASRTGGNGGSGGGAGNGGGGSKPALGGSGNTPSTSPSQGNNGGNSESGDYGTGGGGGAGAVGTAGTGSVCGNGGNGSASSITGSSVTYAGGGGGADTARTVGSGGSGGGGAGSTSTQNNGTVNLGGGGGARTNGLSGAGGKGVVIISVPDADYSGTTTGSPTVATGVSGKTVLTFTGTGSYTA